MPMPKGKSIKDVGYLKRIKELRVSGLSVTEIARKVHSDSSTVSKYLRSMGFVICCPYNKIELDMDLVKHLYFDEKLSCHQIAERLGCSKCVIIPRVRALGCMRSLSEATKLAYKTGGHSSEYIFKRNWKGGRVISGGYVKVYKPGHHLATKRRYVLEHRLVWEETHNEPLPENWVVHHVNGIKTDNRPDNLVAYPRGKHNKLIPLMAERIRKLEIDNRQLKKALEDNQSIFYMSEN